MPSPARRRKHLACLGFGVLAAAARQCHRQFHQDRAAAAGAHRSAAKRRGERLLRPGMSVVVSVNTKPTGARTPTRERRCGLTSPAQAAGEAEQILH
jgi:hypothetical protein